MPNQLNDLRKNVLKKKTKETTLTPIIKLIRDLGCFESIIGSNYEVYDKKGEILYTIKQKPITIPQIYNLIKELSNLEIVENESNKNNKLPKKGRR